jgi:hypothetical protein
VSGRGGTGGRNKTTLAETVGVSVVASLVGHGGWSAVAEAGVDVVLARRDRLPQASRKIVA